MPDDLRIQNPTLDLRLPAHEQAARQQRAAIVALPRPTQPKPPKRIVGRKTWHWDCPPPHLRPAGQPPTFRTHPLTLVVENI